MLLKYKNGDLVPVENAEDGQTMTGTVVRYKVMKSPEGMTVLWGVQLRDGDTPIVVEEKGSRLVSVSA